MEDRSEDIQRACRLGDLSLLTEALAVYPKGLNETDTKLGWTGLYRSVICGHKDTTEYLLQSGADPNIKTRMGDTALHQAADNRQLAQARLLLKYGADPNIQQNDGESALHLACFKGDEEMANVLLTHKANPNLQNTLFGKTPLHYAADYSYGNIVMMLLEFNANPEIKDKHGKTPREIARSDEVQMILTRRSMSMPSPEPSEIPQKTSIECVSPLQADRSSSEAIKSLVANFSITKADYFAEGLVSPGASRSNSEISFTSDCKQVETKIKQLEDFHKKIREKVRASVDTVINPYSGNTSSIFEPDAEKTGYDIVVERKKVVSFGPKDETSGLYNWLCRKGLEECYVVLFAAGYDDLQQISMQMQSKMPVTEQSLMEIGIKKPGHRKRLMLALEEFINPVVRKNGNSMNPFRCCTAEISQNLLMLNMPGLDKWLEALNLKELYGIFTENGYDEMDQILNLMNSPWEITAEDLIDIGISKPGYRHRILSKLKEDSWGLNKKHMGKDEENDVKISAGDMCAVM
ncbi:hypothetical protein SteCoe_843 [Stentor coeruleus]|uniref:SAM domain-containing protein n=1 Tax=Stentor coeruleus TaxID=5963 RepID=A0A1R2D3B9_9CILI|nr:hypothetical protein SteCoe_843 [Stentor coeruleus]